MPPSAMAVDILEQIALGVSEAHSHGILYRDLKPQNIWLQPNGRGGYIVKVLDFGIAKLAEPSALAMELPELEAAPNAEVVAQDENATQVIAPTESGITSAFAEASGFTTTVGATLGTPAFMSPEQGSGMAVSEKSDLYSMAMMAYMMLAGELPFKGNARELIEQQISQPPDAPHKWNPKLSEIVSNVLLESLSKNPDHRAPNSLSFVSRLRAAVEGDVNLLKESRQLNGGNPGSFLAVVLVVIFPAGAPLNAIRTGVCFIVEAGLMFDWVVFALLLLVHVVLAYLAMVWCDLGMTAWMAHTRDHQTTVKDWLAVMWRATKAYPAAVLASVLTKHPLRHGLAHVVALFEDLGWKAARARSEVFTVGSEHLVLALLERRFAVAWLVALYLPVVMVIAQAPMRILFKETVGGGFGSMLNAASFSFLPIYGSFLMAWSLLYERTKRGLGEEYVSVRKRYEAEYGKVGERIRLGTKLWGVMPLVILAGLILAPILGWNERTGDTLQLPVREGRTKDVIRLVAKGADVNKGRGPGGEPLTIAVQSGDEIIAKLLLDKGVKLDVEPKSPGPLYFAVGRRRPGMVKLLLSRGAKPDLIDDRENTPLILAAKSG